jgi:hypothetical protein
MPNGIKYSTSNPTGAIRKGNVAIGVTGNLGPTATSGLYSNVLSTSSTTYVIIKVIDSNTPPIFFAPPDDATLIKLANIEGAGGVSTVNAALAWFSNQSNYTINGPIDFPNIVVDGLTLNLDATVVSSYPNTGTTFYDLSGNTNNASSKNTTEFTTFGGVRTFRLYNNGKYVYNSATDGWNQISNPGISASIASFTFETWLYMTTDNTGQTVIISNAGGGNGYRWGPQSTAAYWLVGGDSDYAEGGVGSFSSIIGRWVQMVGVFDRANTYGNGPKIYCYINGSDVGSTTIPTANNMNNAGPIMPGNCCGAFDGYVSIIRAYNRALTATEITQNWNAQKSYFGL